MSEPLLVAQDLEREYRMGPEAVRVLRGVSLTVNAGESVAIIGASRVGKSTLLHLLGNLDPKTSEVIWDLFLRLQAEHHLAFVIATHNHELARKADRGYRLVDGRAVPWP